MARIHTSQPSAVTAKSATDATQALAALRALVTNVQARRPDHPQRHVLSKAVKQLEAVSKSPKGAPLSKRAPKTTTPASVKVEPSRDPIGALVALARIQKSQNPERVATAVRILAQAHRDLPGGARGAFRIVAKSARPAPARPARRQGLSYSDVAQVINKAVHDALAKHDGPVA